jgi:hypothetical protein
MHYAFQCQQSALPIIYLGLPLTCRKPTREDYIRLLEKLEKCLVGWRGKLISRGGRLQLLNVILSSIPVYYLSCFQLPKWVLRRIDKIQRDFLWAKFEGAELEISLLNWDVVCLPRKHGGLGS